MLYIDHNIKPGEEELTKFLGIGICFGAAVYFAISKLCHLVLNRNPFLARSKKLALQKNK